MQTAADGRAVICDPFRMRRRRLDAVRNFLILVAISSLGVIWGDGFGAAATLVNQIALVLFLAFLVVVGYRYFRENQLKWLVIKPALRAVIIACAAGIVFLVAAGPALLADRISLAGVWALIAVLGLVILWIIVQSRKY